MASNNSNKLLNQNAREAMDKFKMESATTIRTVRFDRPSRVSVGHTWEVTYLARLTV